MWTSKRFSAISLPPAVIADANVVLSALIGGSARLVIASAHGPCMTGARTGASSLFERRYSGLQRRHSTTRTTPKSQSQSYLMCMPLIARAITSCWISAVPSKMS